MAGILYQIPQTWGYLSLDQSEAKTPRHSGATKRRSESVCHGPSRLLSIGTDDYFLPAILLATYCRIIGILHFATSFSARGVSAGTSGK